MAYKHCSKSYRIIDGVRFRQESDNEQDFDAIVAECKASGRRYRKIAGRMWVEDGFRLAADET